MFPALYAILDASPAEERAASLAGILADAGVELIQIRAKKASSRKILEETRKFMHRFSPRGVRVVVNDRPDIAAIAGAGGVHVGQEDLPVEEARRICGTACWVGVSTHNLEQFREAGRTSADYIAVGPIFPTATKQNPDPVVGIEFLRAARKLTEKPIVAIGGITIQSADAVFRAGADSVAVVSDLATAEDSGWRAREYLQIAERVRSARG